MTAVPRRATMLGLLLGAGLSTVALAQGLRKLPPDFVLDQSDGSPGKVTFSHSSHVDSKRPSCIPCHPGTFRILQRGANPRVVEEGEIRGLKRIPVTHAEMEKGRQCGMCHGKEAFGFDSCDVCHHA